MSWLGIELAGRRVVIYRPQYWRRRALGLALAASLAGHAALLLLPHDKAREATAPPRLQVRMQGPVVDKAPAPTPPQRGNAPAKASKPARRIATAPASSHSVAAPPKWSKAEKAEMDGFLEELDRTARTRPQPSLLERSRQMARESAIAGERAELAEAERLELRPNAAPPDPFSVDLYFDGVVRQLNRHAGFVKSEGRHRGTRKAMVAFRLNPDGSLKSFKVLNAGDQEEQIAYIRAVIEHAVPFAAFPPELGRAARSAGLIVCINPADNEGAGLGFRRLGGSQC